MTKRILLLTVMAALAGSAMAQSTRTVRNITVEGLKSVNEIAVRSVMRLKPGQPVEQVAIERDEEAIYSLGYFSAVQIVRRDVNESETDLNVQVTEYSVVKEIRIEGNTIFTDDQITSLILEEQEIGQIWNNNKALPITNAIRKMYTDKGYIINFEQFGPLPESPGTLNVKILETVIGDIRLEGLNRTQPNTVRRIMKSQPGRPLNYDLLQRDIEELFYTYWFEDIKGEQAVGERPEVVDITLRFKEARTAQINAGVALDPQSRLVGTISVGDTNFRGLGQTVGVELEQATVGGGPSARLAFSDRFIDSKDTSLSASVFSRVVYNFTGNGLIGSSSSDTEDRFNERQTGFTLSLSRPYGDWTRASLGVIAKNTRTLDLQTTTTENFVQQDGDLVIFQLGAEYNTSLPSAEPVQGQSARLMIEPGYSNITKIGGNIAQYSNTLGSSTFLRTTAVFRKYWSKAPKVEENVRPEIKLAEPRPVVAFKLELGHIDGTVPFFEQLFIGGTNSLRGYPNQRFWGSNSVLATAEYRYPIQKSFNVIAFADYGSAWGGYGELRDFEQSNKPNFRLGYGLGLAFRTPLGPIRVEFAFDDKGKGRTHFSVGTSF